MSYHAEQITNQFLRLPEASYVIPFNLLFDYNLRMWSNAPMQAGAGLTMRAVKIDCGTAVAQRG
jgi:hypothetical protein